MNGTLTLVLLAAVFLGDLMLVRILWLSRRPEGERSRTASWLFFTGLGVAGLVADALLKGHHPFVALGLAVASGFALAALGSWAVRRAGMHAARAAVHAERP